MTDHVHIYSHKPKATVSHYDLDLFQSAYDCITVSVKNTSYHSPSGIQFDIPVKPAPGMAWKVNRRCVMCDTGNAADLIKLFQKFPAYAAATVEKYVFETDRRKRPGM